MSYTYPPIQPQSGKNYITPSHHDTYAAISPISQSDLAGKSVFITGASKGLGRATALSYARAGASQIGIAARSDLHSLRDEILQAAQTAGRREAPQVLTVKLDVQDLASVKSAAAETEKAFGQLDVLINNAGYLETARPLVESEPEDYWTTWEINYRGVYWVTKEFLPLLIRSKEGGDGKKGQRAGLQTIVNVSSAGAHSLRPGMSAYQGSKFALLKFTEFVCAEYAQDGVVAYSVHPGGVPTELALNMPKATHGILIDTPEMGADSMVFLTQEKRTWLAGRYINLCWDMPALLAKEEDIVRGDKLKMRLIV